MDAKSLMMTDTRAPADKLNEKEILAWLKANPNFLLKYPDILEHLAPPKENMGKGIADFQHYMVQRLKKDKDAITETTRDLIEVSRSNMNSVARIHEATLKILEARNFIQFIQAITMDLGTILDVDMSVLVVETSGQDIPSMIASGIKIVPAGTIKEWMGNETVLLQSDIQGSEAIYGGGARLVRSQAVLRVDIAQTTPPAVLCFGSRDPEMFRPGAGTELIGYLARVVERTFRLWLAVPA